MYLCSAQNNNKELQVMISKYLKLGGFIKFSVCLSLFPKKCHRFVGIMKIIVQVLKLLSLSVSVSVVFHFQLSGLARCYLWYKTAIDKTSNTIANRTLSKNRRENRAFYQLENAEISLRRVHNSVASLFCPVIRIQWHKGNNDNINFNAL